MPKRTYEKQAPLPFFADEVAEVFSSFKPKLDYWHKFQKENDAIGNEFFWWRSRFGDWLGDNRDKNGFEKTSRMDELFIEIWRRFETEFTGHAPQGIRSDFY